MLPVLPFVIGGGVGLIAGAVIKTIMDENASSNMIEDNTSDNSNITTLFSEFDTKEDEHMKDKESL